MRRLLLGLAFVLWAAVPSQAAITVVQTAVNRVNDGAVTFSSGWTTGNHVVVVAIINSTTQTVSLSGINATPTPLAGPTDYVGQSIRGYAFCFPTVLDAADTAFTANSSGSGFVLVVAVEIAGGSCTQDGAEASQTTTALTTHTIGSPTTTTATGSFVIAAIEAVSVSDFTAATGTGLGDGSATADIMGGANVGVGLGQYFVAGAPGAQSVSFTSTVNETALVIMAAVQPAAAATPSKSLMLLGVGGHP